MRANKKCKSSPAGSDQKSMYSSIPSPLLHSETSCNLTQKFHPSMRFLTCLTFFKFQAIYASGQHHWCHVNRRERPDQCLALPMNGSLRAVQLSLEVAELKSLLPPPIIHASASCLVTAPIVRTLKGTGKHGQTAQQLLLFLSRLIYLPVLQQPLTQIHLLLDILLLNHSTVLEYSRNISWPSSTIGFCVSVFTMIESS